MMLRLLGAAGYDVQAAEDGYQGVVCYRQQRSDLVITDIMMPESDGLQAISALRRDDPEVKIIAMSGGGRMAAVDCLDIAQRMGASRILAKPFTGAELLNAVADVLADRDEPGASLPRPA